MKRSWAVMRCVLETAEALELGKTALHFAGDDEAFFYHAQLLCAEDYLVCNWSEQSESVTIKNMTMRGHDLLDRLRQVRRINPITNRPSNPAIRTLLALRPPCTEQLHLRAAGP